MLNMKLAIIHVKYAIYHVKFTTSTSNLKRTRIFRNILYFGFIQDMQHLTSNMQQLTLNMKLTTLHAKYTTYHVKFAALTTNMK